MSGTPKSQAMPLAFAQRSITDSSLAWQRAIVIDVVLEWKMGKKRSTKMQWTAFYSDHNKCWRPPRSDWIKFNSDGFVNLVAGNSAIEGVAKGHKWWLDYWVLWQNWGLSPFFRQRLLRFSRDLDWHWLGTRVTGRWKWREMMLLWSSLCAVAMLQGIDCPNYDKSRWCTAGIGN